jgi:hypothetical protein
VPVSHTLRNGYIDFLRLDFSSSSSSSSSNTTTASTMSLNDPFLIELDRNFTDSVYASIQSLDIRENNVSMKVEPGNFYVSAPPFKVVPFPKLPAFVDGDKENVCNTRLPFHQKTGAELALSEYGRTFYHPNTTWSVKDTVILVRTAEARMSWKETMKLLPKKTLLAARSKTRELRLQNKIAYNGKRLVGSNFTHNCPGVVYEILKEAADVQDTAKFEKQTYLRSTLATIDKTRRETEVAKAAAATSAAIGAARPKRAYKKLVRSWTDEEDQYLMREWWHKRRDEKDIARDMTTKNVHMCKARRAFLVHGDLSDGVSHPQPTYVEVMAEEQHVVK